MFSKILLPIDLEHTESSHKALELALKEAEIAEATIDVMTVAPGFGMPLVASFFDPSQVKQAMREIARHLKAYTDANLPANRRGKCVVTEGNPAEQILRQSRRLDTDLIVISSRDTEMEQILLGSCSAKVVRHAPCTVFVVKDKPGS